MANIKTALILAILILSSIPIAQVICQVGCRTLVIACYAAAVFTVGTGKNDSFTLHCKLRKINFIVAAGAGMPAAISACNAASSKLPRALRNY